MSESQIYNEIYASGGYCEEYFKHYSETLYIDSWFKAAQTIKRIASPQVIDIGCGPGQFANLLFDFGICNYKGIDFSEEAIKMAKIRNDKYRDKFFIDNAYTSDIYKENYNIATLFEVLEHIDEDIMVLKNIRRDTVVLFSVPNYMSRTHVRCFATDKDVYARYGNVVDIKSLSKFHMSQTNIIYLAVGIKCK
ncbi:Ubiquinone biosynthesis O-methyltransferase, mitochondrial [Sporomusa silvacetica DSM 10669]|uniref:Ubiquinone biosynthesis O-methyltransferase, mitochondrial n=1 Tax=Sporomusa silvacetica DSM 10669 TaxID=1123289 RepID=A0ABZ3IRB8_9FIRM|nr:class I SAM-dependent methyltransferase [Sporomusa silvacetica]OZC20484.1 ubiquinone biosynthesis O-methyltransferase [Sporomusa silvacetica DSM 10669]